MVVCLRFNRRPSRFYLLTLLVAQLANGLDLLHQFVFVFLQLHQSLLQLPAVRLLLLQLQVLHCHRVLKLLHTHVSISRVSVQSMTQTFGVRNVMDGHTHRRDKHTHG